MYDSSLSFDKLHSIDLNSILFFIAYMRYRKVSSAGAVLNCSAATVSIMLNRFCDYFGEPIEAKLLMCVAMILGRLEIYPVLILFSGFFWRA